MEAAAQETVAVIVSQGFSETRSYEALFQVVSYKFSAEVHPFMMRAFDHKLNRRFLFMKNKRVFDASGIDKRLSRSRARIKLLSLKGEYGSKASLLSNVFSQLNF